MLLQKTFHLPASREAAQARLADLPGYRRELAKFDLAVVSPEGRAHFVARLPGGFRADVELEKVPGGNGAQTLFRSSGGNVEILGVLEFFSIRPGLTEVVITLDYLIGPFFFRCVDRFGHCMDRFLNRELERVEAALSGVGDSRRLRINTPARMNHHPQ
ncbi:MAG: hypothetical protein ACFUZC_00160 [Chthoniobacteraceae bacterium]